MTTTSGEELRIALGLRGGVSLTVWIGGACREIDALRRASGAGAGDETTTAAGDPVDDFWARVRSLSGYDTVAVDVMAGASAGGLNGVIYAASQVYGFSLDSLRTTWLEVGDLGAMVRGQADDDGRARSADDPYPSLLLGDGYFFVETLETLTELIRNGRPPDPPPRVDLTLTATLVEPIHLPSRRGTTEASSDRFASTFRFRNRGSGWLTDFPPVTTLEWERAAARLALAARATSSYPLAHEAAAVHATRPSSFAGRDGGHGDGLTVDMAGVFGEATNDRDPFLVMDGGVLDNIPLGRAISAIADAPADRPTRRVLVYVRPGAPTVDTSPQGLPPDPRSSWNVVASVVRARIQPETIASDLAALDEQNRGVERTRRLRALTFAGIGDRDALRMRCSRIKEAYVVHRSDADAQEIRRLLDDPIGVLGHDPFPASRSVGDTAWRAPLAMWDEIDALRLDGALAEELCRRIRESPLAVGVGPVGRLTALLLEWARFVERHAAGGAVDAAGAKDRLYRALTIQRELMERPRRLAWVVLSITQPGAHETWAADGFDTVEGLLRVGDDDQLAVQQYLEIGDETVLTGVHQEMLGRVDRLLARQGDIQDLPDGRADLRELVIPCLVDVADDLARMSVPRAVLHDRPDLLDAAGWLHRALSRPAGGRTRVRRADLEALEAVAFQESVVGIPGRRGIQFVELSSASRTPISAAFPRLLGSQGEGARAWESIRWRLSKEPEPIPSNMKLAGNELNNFAAFLRRRWRANDWMWGRLDAVPPLVKILITPEGLVAAAERMVAGRRRAGRDEAVDDLRQALRRAVIGNGPQGQTASENSWPGFIEQTAWAPREAEVNRLAESAVDQAIKRSKGAGAARLAPVEIQPHLVQSLHDALVSARQWRVVAEELALQRADAADALVLGPRETVEEADGYWVGAETLTNPAVTADSKLVRKLLAAARRTARDNLSTKVPRSLLSAVESVAAALSWAWFKDRRGFNGVRSALTAAACLLALVAPALVTTAEGWSRLLASGAVPGSVLFVTGLGAGAVGRRAAAVGLILVGTGLMVVAGAVGANWLGSLAVLAFVLLIGAVGLWGIGRARLTLWRRRAVAVAGSPRPGLTAVDPGRFGHVEGPSNRPRSRPESSL